MLKFTRLKMSLVPSLPDPGWRPDSPASKVPFTQLDEPHILGRKDLEEKYKGALEKQHFLLSEHLGIEQNHFAVKTHHHIPPGEETEAAALPFPSDGITAPHPVGA